MLIFEGIGGGETAGFFAGSVNFDGLVQEDNNNKANKIKISIFFFKKIPPINILTIVFEEFFYIYTF